MIIAMLVLFGLCFGSFVNALVWRVYQQHLPKKKRVAPDADLSLSKGRSMCPHCQHQLGAKDLVPVLSWVYLRGRCRYCSKTVSQQYPIVELLTAVLFVASYIFWPQDLSSFLSVLSFGIWLAILVGFMALIIYDLRWMLLPNRIVFPLSGLGIIFFLIRLSGSTEPLSVILNTAGALAIASGLFYVLFQISAGKWIGGGDVKLGIVLGLLLGTPALAFLMLFIASLFGILVALPNILSGKGGAKKVIPFGPSLIAATIVCVLFGQQLIDWYSTQFLII